jgi:hypothetical protein
MRNLIYTNKIIIEKYMKINTKHRLTPLDNKMPLNPHGRNLKKDTFLK